MLFSDVAVFVLISRTVFVLAFFVVPNVETTTTPLAVPATLALLAFFAVAAIRAYGAFLAFFAVVAIRAFDASLTVLATIAPNAVFAVFAVLTVLTVLTVFTVLTFRAVDVAVLVGNWVGVGGNILVRHGFFLL